MVIHVNNCVYFIHVRLTVFNIHKVTLKNCLYGYSPVFKLMVGRKLFFVLKIVCKILH